MYEEYKVKKARIGQSLGSEEKTHKAPPDGFTDTQSRNTEHLGKWVFH